MKPALIAVALLLAAIPWAARADDWRGFYNESVLKYWEKEMPPGIRENMEEVIWPKLTAKEKQAAGAVTLKFPLELQDSLLNFYAVWGGGKSEITLPISSLRFYGDVALAYAWLNRNGYSLDSVTDYLGMIKYQWPEKLKGTAYGPLEALGIPANARDDAATMRVFQKAFEQAVVFILGHELGHLVYRHPHYDRITPSEAQHNEEEADAFGLEIMRRIGEPPLGMVLYFTVRAHLESPEIRDGKVISGGSTHPLTSARVRALAAGIEKNAAAFSRTSLDVEKTAAGLIKVSAKLNEIADGLDDAGVQGLLKQKGLTAKPEMLKPRQDGAISATPQTVPERATPFNGAYAGEWIDAKNVNLPVEVTLIRKGDSVTGTYSFGSGNLAIKDGIIRGDRLHYNWTWGTDYYGKGVLTVGSDGQLSGTWGYTKSDQGGGSWKLRRK